MAVIVALVLLLLMVLVEKDNVVIVFVQARRVVQDRVKQKFVEKRKGRGHPRMNI